MSRKSVLVMTLIFVLVGILGVAFKVQRVEASGTIVINADGSVDPDTAPISSDDNVTYTFNATIFDQSIVVERDNITLDGAGFTLQGTGSGNGISLSGRSNVTIKNVEIEAFAHGIDLVHSSNNNISGNKITNNLDGIILYKSSNNNTVSGNHITENNYDGISSSNSSNNNIYGNHIIKSDYGIWLDYSSNNNISRNNITDNDYGVTLSFSSNNNTIYRNSITANNYIGINLNMSSNYNSISGNNITNNTGDGIELYSCLSNTISGNNIRANNYDGVILRDSSNNSLTGNTITENGVSWGWGVSLSGSSNNSLSENIVTANYYGGISLGGCSNNSLSGNTITSNNVYGVGFDACSNNSLTGNTMADNEYGVHLEGSSNNSFRHNNFINNTQQVIIDTNDPNVWDNGVEGNYWSDYAGVDSNHDGIGNDWYYIQQNNTDHCPLMGMFHSFNVSLGYNVNVISNSTIEDFTFFESNSTIRMYVSNSSATQSFGFCRVCIPKKLMSPPYTVIINDEPTLVLNFNDTVHENGTHTWIYFAYEHSTHKVEIIPEFPTFLILPIFMIATLLIVIVYQRKHST